MNAWFELTVLSLATFILTRLVVDLDFPPVLWLRDRVIGGWRPLTAKEQADPSYDPSVAPGVQQIDGEPHVYVVRKSWIPLFFSGLMSCPWCVGGWLALGITAGTWAVTGLPVPVLMWLASWALGSLLASRDWP